MLIASARPRAKRSGAPKYPALREGLRLKILEGHYPAGSLMPPEIELARSLRVNPLTLRRALRELAQEGLIVRRRGSGTIVTDRRKPPLWPGRTLRLGILTSTVANPQHGQASFTAAIINGALSAWGLERDQPVWDYVNPPLDQRATWSAVWRGVTVVELGEDHDHAQRAPRLEWVQAARLDGVLCLSIINEPWLERFLELGVPAVLVDFPNDRFASRADQVFADPGPGYRAAVRWLAEQGVKRIHFLGSTTSNPAPRPEMSIPEWMAFRYAHQRVDPDSFLRLNAYRQGMEECGLAVREDWIQFEPSSPTGGRMWAQRQAQRPDAERPEAVLCHDRGQAERAVQAFAERGLRLLGAGAQFGSKASDSSCERSILVDSFEMGKVAGDLLIYRLQKPVRRALRVGVEMPFDPPSGEGHEKFKSIRPI